MRDRQTNYFDVDYGKASVALTSTGVTIVSTVEAYYHGVSFLAGTNSVTIKVFNTASGTGNMIDVIYAPANATGWSDKFNPVVCKNGLTVSITGSNGTGVIFFSQKG